MSLPSCSQSGQPYKAECVAGVRALLVIRTPIAVEPSFIASNEYSTWKRRPSGEKVL